VMRKWTDREGAELPHAQVALALAASQEERDGPISGDEDGAPGCRRGAVGVELSAEEMMALETPYGASRAGFA